MPMETALARAVAVDPAWIAAVQNSVTTNLTMLSPIRVSMGAAILALSTSDAILYRRAWPLALPPLLTGFAAIAGAAGPLLKPCPASGSLRNMRAASSSSADRSRQGATRLRTFASHRAKKCGRPIAESAAPVRKAAFRRQHRGLVGQC